MAEMSSEFENVCVGTDKALFSLVFLGFRPFTFLKLELTVVEISKTSPPIVLLLGVLG